MNTFTNPGHHMVQNYNAEPVLTTIENGGLILYPTDTIWAIGCDATNETAVERILALKQWDYSQPLVLLVSSLGMLKRYVRFIHPRVETLLAFHTKPLTIIYEEGINLPKNATGTDGSVAIRIVQDDFCQHLIDSFGKPLVGTAANIGSQPFPGHFGEISSAVIQGVGHVVRHRQLDKEMGPPSVIARLAEDEELLFIRE